MIRTTNLQRIPMMGFCQVIDAILDGLAPLSFAHAPLTAMQAQMQSTFVALSDAVPYVRASVATITVLELESQRASLLIGMDKVLIGYLRFPNANVQDAARLVRSHLRYRRQYIPAMGQMEATAATTIFLNRMQEPDEQAAVALLPLADWLLHLSAVNAQFETATYQRTGEKMALPQKGTSQRLRGELQAQLKAFATRLNSLWVMAEPAPPDAEVVEASRVINVFVQDARRNHRPKRRKKTSSPQKGKEE